MKLVFLFLIILLFQACGLKVHFGLKVSLDRASMNTDEESGTPAEVVINPYNGYFAGRSPLFVAASFWADDVNKDGKLDLIRGHKTNFTTIHLTESGGIGDYQFNGNPGEFIAMIKSIDINNDGVPDLVALSTHGRLFTQLGLGEDAGFFDDNNWILQHPALFSAYSFEFYDWNNDSFQDIQVSWNGNIRVLLNDGFGNFNFHVDLAGEAEAFFVGDINNNGLADVLQYTLDMDTFGYSFIVQLDTGLGSTIKTPTTSTVAPQNNIVVNDYKPSFKVSDLNGDGNLDIVFHNKDIDELEIFMGNGNGSFTYQVGIVCHSNNLFDLADINKNGRVELIFINEGSNEINITYFETDFTFTSHAIDIPILGNNLRYFKVGDFNGDGNFDYYINNNNFSSIFLGNSEGLFDSPLSVDINLASSPQQVFLKNINGDQYLDLIVLEHGINAGNGGFEVLLGDGLGNFVKSFEGLTSGISNHLIFGDIDSDGAEDVVVATGGGWIGTEINIFRNNMDGTYSPVVFDVGYVAYSVSLKDMDLDGTLDLIVTDIVDSRVYIYYNNGAGGFSIMSSSNFLVNQDFMTGITFATGIDLNQDGLPDLVYTDGFSGFFYKLSIDGQSFDAEVNEPGLQMSFFDSYIEGVDINKDGIEDIIILDPWSGTSTYLNKGTNIFDESYFYAYPQNQFSIGDFNGDDNYDFLFNEGGSAKISTGNESGVFGSVIHSTNASYLLTQVNNGDVNEDGFDDIVGISDVDSKIYIFLYVPSL